MAVTYCHIGLEVRIYTREGGIYTGAMNVIAVLRSLIHRSNKSLQLSVQEPLSSKDLK
jgi:hypothetical protein